MQILHFGLWDGAGSAAVWASDRGSDACHGVLGKFEIFDFVFPDPDHVPTYVLQILVIRPIAIHVALELGCPVFVVACRCCGVFWATVPKAAVDEDCDFLGWKDDIDFDATSLKFDVAVFSETET